MARLRERADVEFIAQAGVIGRLTDQRVERALPLALSLAGFGVLTHLAQWGGEPAPNELAQAFQVAKGTMTNTLQRLERQGFIRITPDAADGRRKRVTLTAAGLAAQRGALAAVRPQLEALRGDFGEPEFEAALPFLRRLRGWLEKNR